MAFRQLCTIGYQPMKVDDVIEKQDLLDCLNRIAPYIHRTPVMTSRMLNEMTGAEVEGEPVSIPG